ncbi:MAG: hypothetical protein HY236_11540 [Acidobacteria bacterium]|nr:hypothetical protein [Acidobacteriota bacterium]
MPGPSSLQSLGGRPFCFFPAIRNVEHNKWTYVRETWSEILVANVKSGQEVWIPRHFLGPVSESEQPVLIVGLARELELKGGAVWPYQHAVIEMPAPPPVADHEPAQPAGTPGLLAAPATESKLGRLILYTLLLGLGACLLVVLFAFEGAPRPQDWFRRRNVATQDQNYLSLTRQDGYHDVVLKLGPPDREQWISPSAAEVQFHLLWYPQRSYAVVLMGAQRSDARYIGTIHATSRVPLDSVPLPGGGSTAAMLRTLPKF